MAEEITTTPTQPPSAAAATPPQCYACEKEAQFGYLWDWGESGFACSVHAAQLKQTAENLSRGVTITSLAQAAAPPLDRAERIMYKSTIATLEAEIEDGKQRGLEFYRANVELTKQVQLHSMREREHTAQLNFREEKIASLQTKLDETETELAELVEEVGRLRTLAKFVDEQPPETLGRGASPAGSQNWPPNPNPHVVDG